MCHIKRAPTFRLIVSKLVGTLSNIHTAILAQTIVIFCATSRLYRNCEPRGVPADFIKEAIYLANNQPETHETYIIPPNFIDTGTIFGGMFKLRNAIEALAIALVFGLPLFMTPFTLTTKIIIMCLTALPLTIFALVGISGESLSSFILNYHKYRQNRRTVYRSDLNPEDEEVPGRKRRSNGTGEKNGHKGKKRKTAGKGKERYKPKKYEKDFAEEFGSERAESRRARRDVEKASVSHEKKRKSALGKKIRVLEELKTERPTHNPLKASTLEEYLPIQKIEKNMVTTKDGRYLRILEVEPINFLLRSAREQKSIIYSFVSYLKISPVKIQIKVLTKKADINKHLDLVRQQMRNEKDEKCRMLQEDYLKLVRSIGMKEAVTRRFFIVFEYEPFAGSRRTEEKDALQALDTVTQTAKNFFRQCGNSIVEHEGGEDHFMTEVFYGILNRRTSLDKPLAERINEVIGKYMVNGGRDKIDDIPISEFISPESIDFNEGHYIKMDGLYHAYLTIPSDGYKSHVTAGWMALLVNAGDGIDVDMYFIKQPKERVMQKLGQQLRINRSKIKETSDTNTDFDDLESAISSGYFLKDGLANNQDFYYMVTMLTITAESEDELEWRVNEMKKLMISQDLASIPCNYRCEQALCSALPLNNIDKGIFDKSKRNVLTMGAGSCYPFVSYEVSDDNGILMGINKHNNSMVVIDIFNTLVYKNANSATRCGMKSAA